MSFPVVSGEDLIELIDKHGGMVWQDNSKQRTSVLIENSTELTVGMLLVRVTAKSSSPEYYMVDSPIFRLAHSPSGFEMAQLPKITSLPGLLPYSPRENVQAYYQCSLVACYEVVPVDLAI